jgi:hypothetical protein
MDQFIERSQGPFGAPLSMPHNMKKFKAQIVLPAKRGHVTWDEKRTAEYFSRTKEGAVARLQARFGPEAKITIVAEGK